MEAGSMPIGGRHSLSRPSRIVKWGREKLPTVGKRLNSERQAGFLRVECVKRPWNGRGATILASGAAWTKKSNEKKDTIPSVGGDDGRIRGIPGSSASQTIIFRSAKPLIGGLRLHNRSRSDR